MSDKTDNRFYRTRHPDHHGPGCGCVGYGPDRLSEVAHIVAKWSCPPLENPANTGLLRELRAVLNDQLRGVDPHAQQVDRLIALADLLAGRIARVEALADAADSAAHLSGDSYGAVVSTDDLRAALDGNVRLTIPPGITTTNDHQGDA